MSTSDATTASTNSNNTPTTKNKSPLFFSTSSDKPSMLEVIFDANNANEKLGTELTNADVPPPEELFTPGYALIRKLLDDGDDGTRTVARKYGVKVGDIIVAINGEGYRRFKQEFNEDELYKLNLDLKLDLNDDNDGKNNEKSKEEEEKKQDNSSTKSSSSKNNDDNPNNNKHDDEMKHNGEVKKKDKNRVLKEDVGKSYEQLLETIQMIKFRGNVLSSKSLVITLERFGWDSSVHSWGRFLYANKNHVPNTTKNLQDHMSWRESTFPIDLTSTGIQSILKLNAIVPVDIGATLTIRTKIPPKTVKQTNDLGTIVSTTTEIITTKELPLLYVNFLKLHTFNKNFSNSSSSSAFVGIDDYINSFVVYIEKMIHNDGVKKNEKYNPRNPKMCLLIDITGIDAAKVSSHDMVILTKIYGTFSSNYPGILEKMIIYPIPGGSDHDTSSTIENLLQTTLSFLNKENIVRSSKNKGKSNNNQQRQNIILTDDLDVVCNTFSWNKQKVSLAGGLSGFVAKHEDHTYDEDIIFD